MTLEPGRPQAGGAQVVLPSDPGRRSHRGHARPAHTLVLPGGRGHERSARHLSQAGFGSGGCPPRSPSAGSRSSSARPSSSGWYSARLMPRT